MVKWIVNLIGPIVTRVVELAAVYFSAKKAGKLSERDRIHEQQARAVRDAKNIEDNLDRKSADDKRQQLRDKWTRK